MGFHMIQQALCLAHKSVIHVDSRAVVTFDWDKQIVVQVL